MVVIRPKAGACLQVQAMPFSKSRCDLFFAERQRIKGLQYCCFECGKATCIFFGKSFALFIPLGNCSPQELGVNSSLSGWKGPSNRQRDPLMNKPKTDFWQLCNPLWQIVNPHWQIRPGKTPLTNRRLHGKTGCTHDLGRHTLFMSVKMPITRTAAPIVNRQSASPSLPPGHPPGRRFFLPPIFFLINFLHISDLTVSCPGEWGGLKRGAFGFVFLGRGWFRVHQNALSTKV